MAEAITKGVKTGNTDLLTAMREDRNKRHDLRGIVDSVANDVADIKSRVKGVEDRTHSLLGDGTGDSGMVNQIKRDLGSTITKVDDVQRDVTYIKDKVESLSQSQSSAQTKQDMWAGMGMGIKILLGFFAGLAGVGMFFLTLYEVIKHTH